MSKIPAHPPRWRGKVLLSSGLGQSVAILLASALLGLAFNSNREVPLKPKAKIQAPTTIPDQTSSTPEANANPQPAAEEKVGKPITGDQLAEMTGDGITLVLDARNPEDFDLGHIPDAVSFPYEQFESYYSSVSGRLLFPEQPIVCYCEGGDCTLSHDLASELFTMGYTNVFVLVGGYELWTADGREIEVP